MYLLKKIDMLGQDIGFEVDSSRRFKTYPGAFISLLVIVACSVLGFLFGQQIYKRQESQSSVSQVFSTGTIDLNRNPLMFFFANRAGQHIRNYQEYFNINQIVYSFSDKGIPSAAVHNVISNCTSSNITSFQSLFSTYTCEGGGCFCLDQKFKPISEGELAFPNSTAIHITYNPCDPKTQKCASDLSTILQNYIFTFVIIDTFIDPNNYLTPIQNYLKVFSVQGSAGLYKRFYLTLSNNTFISDIGWILESKQEDNYIQVKSTTTDVMTYTSGITPYGAVTISSTMISGKVTRSYMKVQDLAAKIGGLINALLIIAYICSYHFLRFCYMEELYSQSINMEMMRAKSNQSSTKIKLNNFMSNSNIVKLPKEVKDSKDKDKMKENEQESRDKNKSYSKNTLNIKKENTFNHNLNQQNHLKTIPEVENNLNNFINENKLASNEHSPDKSSPKRDITVNNFVFLANNLFKFAYLRYLKSLIGCGTYWKAVDIRFDYVREKVSMIAFSKLIVKNSRKDE